MGWCHEFGGDVEDFWRTAVDGAPYAPDGGTADSVESGTDDHEVPSNGDRRRTAPDTEDASPGSAVDRLDCELRELRGAMKTTESLVPESVAVLARQLPRWVGTAVASIIETGEDPENRLEQMESLLLATTETVRSRHGRAAVAGDGSRAPAG